MRLRCIGYKDGRHARSNSCPPHTFTYLSGHPRKGVSHSSITHKTSSTSLALSTTPQFNLTSTQSKHVIHPFENHLTSRASYNRSTYQRRPIIISLSTIANHGSTPSRPNSEFEEDHHPYLLVNMADQSNHTPPPPTNPRVPQVALNNTATRPLRTLLPAPRGLDPDIEGSSQQGLAQAQGVRQHHEVENTARVVSMAKRTLTSAATSSTPDYMFVNPSDLIQPSTNGQDEDVIMDDALTGTGCLSNWDLPCGQPSCIFCGQRQGDAGGSSAGSQQVGNPPTPSSRTSPCPPPLDFTYIPEIDNYLFEPPSDTATELAYPSWIISEEDRQQYRTAMIARRIDERANPGPRGQQLQPGVDSTADSSSANQTQPVVPQTSSHPPVQSSAQNAQPQAANTQSSPPVPDNNSSPFVFMVTERELPLGYWKPHYALPGSIQFVPTKFSSDTTDKPSSVAAVEVDSVGNPLMDVYIITKDGKSLGRWVTFAGPGGYKQPMPVEFEFCDPESPRSSSRPRTRTRTVPSSSSNSRSKQRRPGSGSGAGSGSRSSSTSSSGSRSRSNSRCRRNPYMSRTASRELDKQREARRLARKQELVDRIRAEVRAQCERRLAADRERTERRERRDRRRGSSSTSSSWSSA